MLEWFMLLGIGCLSGCLMMVVFLPFVHERAVRLTARRYRAQTPLTVAEMAARQDLVRADFAMSMRRLEVIVEEARTKAALQRAEIGRQAAEIHRLKLGLTHSEARPAPSRSRRVMLLKRA